MKDVLLDTLWENEKFKSVWSVHLRLVFPTYDGLAEDISEQDGILSAGP